MYFSMGGAVSELHYRKGMCTADVLDDGEIYNPIIATDDARRITGWNCTCAELTRNHPCAHIAALCKAYYDGYSSSKKASKTDIKKPDRKSLKEKIADLEKELLSDCTPSPDSFMDYEAIESQLFKTDDAKYDALLALSRGEIIAKTISQCFSNDGKQFLRLAGTAIVKNAKFPVILSLNENFVLYASCQVYECHYKNTDYWGELGEICTHVGALYLSMKQDMIENNFLDATNQDAKDLMNSFLSESAKKTSKTEARPAELISLVPRIRYADNCLELSFKTGSSKLYVIKNISEFVSNVQTNSLMQFGKSTELEVGRHNFDAASLKYLDFIESHLSEVNEYNTRIPDSRFGYESQKISIRDSLILTGKWLDDFFEIAHGESFEYTTSSNKKKQTLALVDKEPELSMVLSPIPPDYDHTAKNKSFFGVSGYMKFPSIIEGRDYLYYIENNTLCRISDKVSTSIEALLPAAIYANEYETDHGNRRKLAKNNLEINISIGLNKLSEFYGMVLPQLEEFISIRSENLDFISEYLPDDLEIIFYLDASDGNILCKGVSKYGEATYSLLDCERNTVKQRWYTNNMRVMAKEREAVSLVTRYLPAIDFENDLMHCDGDENAVFKFLGSGIDTLMSIGEVHVTDAFKSLNIHKKLNLTVGVSVSQGLLDLTIASDTLSRQDILDVLDSYKQKKQYHRLKNGSFVNTEDESVKMLSEILDASQISSKDFLKDNIHLPAFRALYLDKLLEENDSLYEDRDTHFRQLIKDFKTISDSDFEVPQTLNKILRNYQKTGYKWMCTLEQYHFGGILCDDMGLGKTLQVISVLLAACKKNMETSLIVCPASLVYNWEEEFTSFAPGLRVKVIAGTKSERLKILSELDKYDAVITSYDLLRIDIAEYENYSFHYQIADEAQFIKNPKTGAAKAVKSIKSSVRFALTGTPIENRLSELWSIFDYIMPGYLYRYEAFKKTFELPIVKHGSEDALQRLKKMVAPFVLRRLKQDVLKDLPDKIEKNYVIPLADKQQQLYDARALKIRNELAATDDAEFAKNKLKILAELTRLRQICCDPSLCYDNFESEAAKRQACIELVNSGIENGHRMLIFSQFTSMLDLLEKDLDENGINYFKITGSTPKEARISLVNKFNNGNVPVFLISLKAGGTGLNLTGADMVIHYDPWWNLAVQNQATDRTHRIGQKNTVIVYKLIAKNTIEEKIVKIQKKTLQIRFSVAK